MKIGFPPDFLWGSSISSYQTEGGNETNDWALWEKEHHLEPAGKSANHYQLFQSDISLARSLGQNSLRFSIEWARIYPSRRNISFRGLNHYRDVVSSLKNNNMAPVVTLHHFTNPMWFINNGGWLNPEAIDDFLSYVRTVVSYLRNDVQYWIIFNEPLVYVYNGFIKGIWPPGMKSIRKALKAIDNISKAYVLSYKIIKSIYSRRASYVSIAKHMRVFSPCFYLNIGQNNVLAFLRSYFFNFRIINSLLKKKSLDFISLNYYCREFVKWGIPLGDECNSKHHKGLRNSLGWFVYPEGLYYILMKLKRYKVPVIITENGTSENNISAYHHFLRSHIDNLAKALNSGVNIRGYFWWSLLDNFEWDKGYKHKFGLVEVDFNNFSRVVRSFALEYKKICESNIVEIDYDIRREDPRVLPL